MGKAHFKLDELNNLRDDITKVFDSFFDHADSKIVDYDFVPPINVIEKKSSIVVEMEIPGVDNEDIDVSFTKGTLVLKGIKKSRTAGSEDLFHRIERNYGKFHRNISVPYDIEEDKITAEVKKGVLFVTLVKKEENPDKKINIVFED